MAACNVTAENLRELLSYDPETGNFVWLVRSAHRVNIGDIAGCVTKSGYVLIRTNNMLFKAHRLAWLYMLGRFPDGQIDHIDGNPSNNRFANLRECSDAENKQNTGIRRSNTTGSTGVCFYPKRNKWTAGIQIGGKKHHLGYFDTPEAAHAAYVEAKARLHTFQPTIRA